MRREIVHGDSDVGVDNVVILSYNMPNMSGGRFKYTSFAFSIKTTPINLSKLGACTIFVP